MIEPTQVRRPWRATVRTVFQFVLALATLLPFIAFGIYQDADQAPAIVGQVLAVAAILTRVMATRQVEEFLDHWFPWLAAEPTQLVRNDRGERGHGEVALAVIAAAVLFAVLVYAGAL